MTTMQLLHDDYDNVSSVEVQAGVNSGSKVATVTCTYGGGPDNTATKADAYIGDAGIIGLNISSSEVSTATK